MAKARVITTDAEIDAAIARAQHFIPGPAAVKIDHDPGLNLLIIHLGDGHRLPIPMEDLPELANATHEQLSHYEILGPGTGIHFPDIDADLYVPHLLEGRHLSWDRTQTEGHTLAA